MQAFLPPVCLDWRAGQGQAPVRLVVQVPANMSSACKVLSNVAQCNQLCQDYDGAGTETGDETPAELPDLGNPEFPRDHPQFPRENPQYPRENPQFPRQQPEFPRQQPEFPRQQPEFPRQQPEFPRQPKFPREGEFYLPGQPVEWGEGGAWAPHPTIGRLLGALGEGEPWHPKVRPRPGCGCLGMVCVCSGHLG